MISSTETPSSPLLGRTVFSVGPNAFQWRDIVLASMVSGEWQLAEAATRRGLVAAAHARAAGDTLPHAALDDAMRKFRYERNLGSASDAEAWLARWQLSVTEWRESLRRALLVERFRDVVRGLTLTDAMLDRATVRAAMHGDAVCGSLYDRLARTLAAHAAAHVRVQAEGAAGNGASAGAPHDSDIEKSLSRLDLSVLGVTADDARRRLAYLHSLQASVVRFRRLVVTDARVSERITARQVEWTRFSCRLAFFPDRDMAAEAVLCVREDGRDLADIATDACAPLVEKRFFLDEADPALKVSLLRAIPGDAIGPVAIGREWAVFDVRDKRPPSESDPAVRRRAEKELLGDGFEREIERSVRWSAP